MLLKLSLVLVVILPAKAWLFGSEKCYGSYGCFANSKPYNNAKGNVPDSPEHQNIQFLLYTRHNAHTAQVLKPHDHGSIQKSHFKHHAKTFLIVHGYTDNGKTNWIKTMTAELLKKEDANVIAVDWQTGAAQVNYFQAAANTRVVGAVAAQLIKDVHSVGQTPYSKFHIIGHSLGSHIAGYAGERVHGLGRITGLDPAGLCFEKFDIKTRLDPSDASYVDVIHTDAETLFQLAFGMAKAIGHTDYYPNGGKNQPGCPHIGNHALDLITGKITQLSGGVSCSHMRAVEFFISSINSHCKFNSQPCTSASLFSSGHCRSCGHGCSQMGYHSSSHDRGSYYLATTSHSPYC
ncbi:hypothetical protein LOTGIDRAFT_226820 [Lottia gigantea]|uniref:Lipase domain-containing protein n=1 Tax=Lottia gigantea TaxID=225164 RepID=V4AQM2_LOTGI|nr:hypothetical protein LOTGIDRAFT_226820 [Lottia gigantea]ESO97125.1 hypothetical protein LOTGIDRAFT_226820 [Lottia gigantea]